MMMMMVGKVHWSFVIMVMNDDIGGDVNDDDDNNKNGDDGQCWLHHWMMMSMIDSSNSIFWTVYLLPKKMILPSHPLKDCLGILDISSLVVIFSSVTQYFYIVKQHLCDDREQHTQLST
jgi:hypothetical protein